MLLGAIAPDAKEEKRESHFEGTRLNYSDSSLCEYGRFIMKYRDSLSDAYMLGYLTHLVVDNVWLGKSYYSGLKERMNTDWTLYDRYHRDFRLCNAKLHAKHAHEGLYDALDLATSPINLNEVDSESVMNYKILALDDFHYPVEHLDLPLQVFTFDDILEYIERSSYLAFEVCRPWSD